MQNSFKILIAVACILALCGCGRKGDFATKEDLERSINKELPLGSTKGDVISFLHTHHFEYSENNENGSPEILAVVRTDNSNIVKKSLQLKFVFSDRRQLKSYNVSQVFTGP